ncbi:hypothetical protein NSQ59_27400 [Margalitia sp. FSL K6-0131]|uniref:hypothetical protein n=1 Tax=Margalitia sp. FSL K6-0131 TaxID=2954604 RepID=UPI0030FB6232
MKENSYKQQNLDIPEPIWDMFEMIKKRTDKNKNKLLINWIFTSFKEFFPNNILEIEGKEIAFPREINKRDMEMDVKNMMEKGLIIDDTFLDSLSKKHNGYIRH